MHKLRFVWSWKAYFNIILLCSAECFSPMYHNSGKGLELLYIYIFSNMVFITWVLKNRKWLYEQIILAYITLNKVKCHFTVRHFGNMLKSMSWCCYLFTSWWNSILLNTLSDSKGNYGRKINKCLEIPARIWGGKQNKTTWRMMHRIWSCIRWACSDSIMALLLDHFLSCWILHNWIETFAVAAVSEYPAIVEYKIE